MVSKETKETILATIDEVFQKMNSISWIDRQKAMSKEAFKNTEKILYCFNVLKEHVSNEQEYLEIALHRKSKSITSYIKNGGGQVDDDTKLHVGFGNRQEKHIDILNNDVLDMKKINLGYIPPKEIISSTENFVSLYADYRIAFEETYYDLARLLECPLKRGTNTAE